MRVNIVSEGISAEGELSRHKVRDCEQYRPHMAAGRACGIDVVEIGRVRTNQLHFKADQMALAICLLKLGPKLGKYTIFGYERLHP
ncbi:MAG: hypothetical protein WCC99_10800 [Candidatus Sulfotelmatobacter sp.]